MINTIVSLLLLLPQALPVTAFASGKGFGKNNNSNNNPSFVTFDRFKSICPADIDAIRQFDPSLVPPSNESNDKASDTNEDIWVAVYRSNNNLPSVFVRDAFFDAMAQSTSTSNSSDDSETITSTKSVSIETSSAIGAGIVNTKIMDPNAANKPVAVARLTPSPSTPRVSIIDNMRCTLKKENTNEDCDGGSEHTESIGVCIDELVLAYLQQQHQQFEQQQQSAETNNNNNNNNNDNDDKTTTMKFDGGIRFRGTLVSGKLLAARGFREVNTLSSDMHSHESDFNGALEKYAERSASKEVAKNPGARDRALKIVSLLAKIDRDGDQSNSGDDVGSVMEEGESDGEEDEDFDPWASVKKYL